MQMLYEYIYYQHISSVAEWRKHQLAFSLSGFDTQGSNVLDAIFHVFFNQSVHGKNWKFADFWFKFIFPANFSFMSLGLRGMQYPISIKHKGITCNLTFQKYFSSWYWTNFFPPNQTFAFSVARSLRSQKIPIDLVFTVYKYPYHIPWCYWFHS